MLLVAHATRALLECAEMASTCVWVRAVLAVAGSHTEGSEGGRPQSTAGRAAVL